MINAISAADIAFIMSSSQAIVNVCLVTKPLGVFSSETKWLNASLLFLRMNYVKNVSKSSLLLEPPKEKMLSTLSARSFYAAAPCLWNSLLSCEIFNHYVVLNKNLRPTFFGQAKTFFLFTHLLIYFII